jgi:hypothetical protein
MQSKATTVDEYLAELPADRRDALAAMRAVIRKNLPKGYEEGMLYGMIGYYVPHSLYPAGYHCDPKQPLGFVCLGSQKNYMSLYMMCIYIEGDDGQWFRDAWAKSGKKKLDMGKSCIRFKSIDDVPLDLIGRTIKGVPVKQHIEFYEKAFKQNERNAAERRATKKAAAGKPAAKKPAAKKPAAKKKTASNRAAK